jgi:hypothetical protein
MDHKSAVSVLSIDSPKKEYSRIHQLDSEEGKSIRVLVQLGPSQSGDSGVFFSQNPGSQDLQIRIRPEQRQTARDASFPTFPTVFGFSNFWTENET